MTRMIRMIAPDFAGTARVECIPASFSSLSRWIWHADCHRISLCRPAATREQQLWKFKRGTNKITRIISNLEFPWNWDILWKSQYSFWICFAFHLWWIAEKNSCNAPSVAFPHLATQLLLGQKNGWLNKEPPGKRGTFPLPHASKAQGIQLFLQERFRESDDKIWKAFDDVPKKIRRNLWLGVLWQLSFRRFSWKLSLVDLDSWFISRFMKKTWLFGFMYSCLLVLLAAWLKLDGLRPGLHGMMYVPLLKINTSRKKRAADLLRKKHF